MEFITRIYSCAVANVVRSVISSFFGKLLGSTKAIQVMQGKIQQMGLETTDLKLRLASKNIEISDNTNFTFAYLNSREKMIHDFVQSALVAKQLKFTLRKK